uniref:Uncharacterized protein n=1 Tax=Acrobeloides nanus TaxID=290746 RepID=A0A914DW81_9BILA
MTMIGGNSPLYDSLYRPEYEQLNVNTQGPQVDGNIYRSYSVSPSSQPSHSMFSPNLPPIQYVVRKDPNCENYDQISPPNSPYGSVTGSVAEVSIASPGSTLPGSVTSQLDNALMESMSPPSSQDQVKNANLKNDHDEKNKNPRGRPRKPVDPKKGDNKKNTYMQNYHQKIVKNCEKNEELVNLYGQLVENLSAHILDNPKVRKLNQQIQEIKNWLKDDKNRRPNSKLLFPKRK